jgi:hypothetical protein
MTTLESVLRSRDVVTKKIFPYVVMIPRDLDEPTLMEINTWIDINCYGHVSVRNIRDTYSFRFSENEDFMLFSLRWL